MFARLFLAFMLLTGTLPSSAQSLSLRQLRQLPGLDLNRLGYLEFRDELPPEDMQSLQFAKDGDSILIGIRTGDDGSEDVEVWCMYHKKAGYQSLQQQVRKAGFVFRKREGFYYRADGSYAWETIGFSTDPGDFTVRYRRHMGKELGAPIAQPPEFPTRSLLKASWMQMW